MDTTLGRFILRVYSTGLCIITRTRRVSMRSRTSLVVPFYTPLLSYTLLQSSSFLLVKDNPLKTISVVAVPSDMGINEGLIDSVVIRIHSK